MLHKATSFLFITGTSQVFLTHRSESVKQVNTAILVKGSQ